MKKNCLIFVVDALRYDALSGSRNEGDLHEAGLTAKYQTPHLSELEDKGVTLPNLHSTYTSTPSASASLLTGLYPREHGVYDFFRFLPDEVKTLPDIFSSNNFYTLLGKSVGLFDRIGLSNRFDEVIRTDIDRYLSRIKELNDQGKRVFGYFHTFDVHHPYCLSVNPPTEDYHDFAINFANELCEEYDVERRFNREDAQVRTDTGELRSSKDLPLWDFFQKNLMNHHYKDTPVFEDPLSVLMQLYVQGVNLLDKHVLKKLKSFLFNDPSGQDTLCLFTADHGERRITNKQGSDTFDHSERPDEEVLKVPGILLNSGLKQNQVGGWKLTSLVDIAPTVLDAFKITLKSNRPLSGENLAEEPPDQRYVFADSCKTFRGDYDPEDLSELGNDTIFPSPGMLNLHCVLSSDGMKLYLRALELSDEDYQAPFEEFIRKAYAKNLLRWLEDDEIPEIKAKFNDPSSVSERKQVVDSMKQHRRQNMEASWEPELYNWRNDPLEKTNLLEEINEDYSDTVSELSEILINRFPDPLDLDFEEPDWVDKEDQSEETVENLKGLGYL